MKVKQFEIWIADLNPRQGSEPGKVRPVIIMQTDLLNDKAHPSTVICPVTTNVKKEATFLRVHLTKGAFKLKEDCDIMMDQIRTIDNKRLLKKIGGLDGNVIRRIKENVLILLDIF